ncbi:NepR family anti-sigma factor [Hyphobacterium sp. SN044]|uniref:NepR family anti-sigma factor n=1 Tax=Hyphobacterium sp. SN044 TaxID=2912575 RepID=UPI00235111BD|nr:NepR family anti-sigma factor [Hyphobacterium sp. SN044]
MTKKAEPSQAHRDSALGGAAGRTAQDAIGRRLREFYDEVVNEPVPDDFMDLLSKLDRAEEEESGDESR